MCGQLCDDTATVRAAQAALLQADGLHATLLATRGAGSWPGDARAGDARAAALIPGLDPHAGSPDCAVRSLNKGCRKPVPRVWHLLLGIPSMRTQRPPSEASKYRCLPAEGQVSLPLRKKPLCPWRGRGKKTSPHKSTRELVEQGHHLGSCGRRQRCPAIPFFPSENHRTVELKGDPNM